MIGILAALALVSYRKWLDHARIAQTKDLVQGVMLSEKLYYDETGGYLGCSTSFTDYYPAAPDDRKRAFHNPSHSDYGCWRLLNAGTDAPVYVGIAVVAGVAGNIPPQPTTAETFTWPVPTTPWYVVQATGDIDADGVQSYFVGDIMVEELEHVDPVCSLWSGRHAEHELWFKMLHQAFVRLCPCAMGLINNDIVKSLAHHLKGLLKSF